MISVSALLPKLPIHDMRPGSDSEVQSSNLTILHAVSSLIPLQMRPGTVTRLILGCHYFPIKARLGDHLFCKWQAAVQMGEDLSYCFSWVKRHIKVKPEYHFG